MLPCHAQGNAVHHFPLYDQVIGRPPKPVICDILCRIRTGTVLSKSDNPASQPLCNLLNRINAAVNHQQPLGGKLLCKQPEGMADILDILKEIQVVLLNVQYDLHGGME